MTDERIITEATIKWCLERPNRRGLIGADVTKRLVAREKAYQNAYFTHLRKIRKVGKSQIQYEVKTSIDTVLPVDWRWIYNNLVLPYPEWNTNVLENPNLQIDQWYELPIGSRKGSNVERPKRTKKLLFIGG